MKDITAGLDLFESDMLHH